MLRVAAGLTLSLLLLGGGLTAGVAVADAPIQYGYTMMDSTGLLFGTPLPCPPRSGPLAQTTAPAPLNHAVGASFFRDPAFPGRVRIAQSNGLVNTGSTPTAGLRLAGPIVAVATAPSGEGFWLAGADGGVFAGDGAPFAGSMGGRRLRAPVVAIAATPGGNGYWLAAADGGVFAFGDAPFLGSLGNQPRLHRVVAIAATSTGLGYWLAAADGSVFPFGDAVDFGSRAGQHLNAPITSMAATQDGQGYWLAAADGGVFAYGNALFTMSLADRPRPSPIVAVSLWPQRCPS
jgi:hypothetical protein